MPESILELIDICKSYPGVQALSHVNLAVASGEVVGLIGENGAGKSTLMRILGGVTAPSSGVIRLRGERKDNLTVSEAIRSGIAFVHQELNLFDNLDVAANVFFGREPRSFGLLQLIDTAAIRSRTQPLLDRLGADFKPDTKVSDLSLAQRQLVEIAKALSLGAEIVIMDEPTSSLTLTETNRLLEVVAELKAGGVSVIFITHRLHEIEQCADRVVALRDGAVVGMLQKADIDHDRMIRLMIGRDLKALYSFPKDAPGEEILLLKGIRTTTYPDRPVNFSLRRGEIVGLAGLVGSGRTELARTVFGIDRPIDGTIEAAGHPLTIKSPRDAIAHGIYLIPEDRKRAGLILEDDITNNISLPNLEHFAIAYLVDHGREETTAKQQTKRLNIRTPSVSSVTATLSGGNQQKVVLAKWLAMSPNVMLFDEPTRGIDVGAKSEIYSLIRALSDAGVAVLMISSDMEEVIGVSDRILVMHEGQISGELSRDQFSEHNVMQLAVGKAMNSDQPC
ncbi:sugar ABC transporter ATP-binding protein [Bradyrhizobium sp.]|jgi:ribose transport system ATP-binding protein|uniref:sugar ABC transporter ATP-binding protein n=1 Tax=Bradyrhizobium sp. TaxID=376 RepID=UPI003C1E61A9